MTNARLESVARALTIFSFILLCWVAHRALQVRETCVSSSFVANVQFDGVKATNCRFQSRLDLRTLTTPLTAERIGQLRALEVLEPLASVLSVPGPYLNVEISDKEPLAFELSPKGLRLGREWLKDGVHVRRALTMALLKNRGYNQFQLEVFTDFLLLAIYRDDILQDGYSLRRDVKFPTAAPSLESYCNSPFRSLAHMGLCHMPEGEEDPGTAVWGFRPLLASALWRAFNKLPLADQVNVIERMRGAIQLPPIETVQEINVENLVAWFTTTFDSYALNLGITASAVGGEAIARAMKELEVEAPTHWELTVDVTKTPAWKEIVEQLKSRSRFRAKERLLVFTPEGEVALPSGLKVAWNADDIQSQKHVLIACDWPTAKEAVHVQARQIYARKQCGKLNGAFWD